jgi:hypothetical protein
MSASLRAGSNDLTVYFRLTDEVIADGADSLFIASLLPAMRWGMALYSRWPVSPRLQRSVPTIQDVFHAWDPNFQTVPVHIPVREPALKHRAAGVAAFFSGGVDSFYTALKHQEEITALILVHGFDVPLSDQTLWLNVSSSVRAAAKKLSKRLIEVETNLGLVSSRYVSWPLYHGSALASVAALLSPGFRKVYIPSSYSYAQLIPWGSHPLVDPLWSSEAVEIVHDGAELNRAEKIRALAASEVVLDHLRVCWENKNGEYNCGKCEKCLRTMVSLYINDALHRCRTFPEPLRLDRVARIRSADPDVRTFVEENLAAAMRWKKDPRLIRALQASLRNRHTRDRWSRLMRRLWSAARRRWDKYVRANWDRVFGRATAPR